MDNEMYAAISSHLSEIDSNDDIWVGVITGAGDKAFTAGADLVGMHGTAEKAEVGWSSPRPTRFDLGLEVQKPLIAAVNGYCLAGGLELALVCDIRIASETAQFGCPEVKWNLLHGYGAQLLPRIVGTSNAMYLLLTGQFIDAVEALRIGLVNEVVPPDHLMRRVHQLVVVIESGDRVGGRTLSAEHDTYWYNSGAQFVWDARTVALCSELGLDVLGGEGAQSAVFVNGKLATAPDPNRLFMKMPVPWVEK